MGSGPVKILLLSVRITWSSPRMTKFLESLLMPLHNRFISGVTSRILQKQCLLMKPCWYISTEYLSPRIQLIRKSKEVAPYGKASNRNLKHLHWHWIKLIHLELSEVIQLFTHFLKTFYLLLWGIISLFVMIYTLHSLSISKSSGMKSVSRKASFTIWANTQKLMSWKMTLFPTRLD